MKKKTPEEKFVSISKITVAPQYQMREELDESTIEQYQELYKEDPDRLPPIVLVRKGKKLHVVEGFHRLEAAKKAGLKDIRVIILDDDGNHNGLWHALGSNKHGLQMKRGDLKKAVNMALDHFPGEKQVEIARHVGCSEAYVRKIKKDRQNRTSAISEETFDSLIVDIREVYLQLSDEQAQRFREEIEELLDGNGEEADDDSEDEQSEDTEDDVIDVESSNWSDVENGYDEEDFEEQDDFGEDDGLYDDDDD